MNPHLPSVVWIATGGTIEAVGSDRMDRTAYGESGRRVPPAELLDALPETAEFASVRSVSWSPGAGSGSGHTAQPPSHAWTLDDLVALAARVDHAVDAEGAEGVVVSCGTNGLEETAFALSLLTGERVPVVVTGAMRPASALGGDGPGNLLGALRVAADARSAGRGVLVVLGDEVHAAREVTKSATYRLDAFRSPESGPLGAVGPDGRVCFLRRPEPDGVRPPLRLSPPPPRVPRVEVLVSSLGADGALVDAAVAAGAAGIVSAGTGGGYPTPGEQAALERASAEGVTVCQASRTGSGRVVATAGTRAGGFFTAGGLNAYKARVLLALALAAGCPTDCLQALFDRA